MRRRWLALPACALAACQTTPYVAPEVPVPAQWAHQAPAAANGGKASLADQPWAQVFPVPELTALIEDALVGSSKLIVAIRRIGRARAQ